MMNNLFTLQAAIIVVSGYDLDKDTQISSEEDAKDIAYLTSDRRSDGVPSERKEKLQNSTYLSAYIQALIDMHYFDYQVLAKASGSTVYLENLPSNKLIANSIISFVSDFPGVDKVESTLRLKDQNKNRYSEAESQAFPKQENQFEGVWMPQQTVLFAPLIADPRQVMYSSDYRFHDTALGSKITGVAFGDVFPVFRWLNVGPYNGDFEISVEGGLWAVFSLSENSSALLNSDFYIGFPFTYAYGKWAHRLRLSHLSSHLGDEYIKLNPTVVRKNLSYESIDVATSFQVTDSFRVYGGIGGYILSDKEYPMKQLFINYGAEARLLGTKDFPNRLYMQPFFAMNFSNSQFRKWDFDQNYLIGLEWSKLRGIGRKVRVFIKVHDGFSEEGQFQNLRSRYLGVGFSYGF